MKISLKWLRELVACDWTLQELKHNFSLHSAEVASLEPLAEATNLVIGYVVACEKHKDADKLSVCSVDCGKEVLQIVCGAANVAKGQKVIVALEGALLAGGRKIKKTKIRGVESNGMICSLEELGIEHKYHQEDGIHVLPEEAPIGANALPYMHLDDDVLELDLTPNRADLLSMLGVAHEMMAMTGNPVKYPAADLKRVSERNPVAVFTETNGCMSYYGQVISNISVTESPYWLRSRLIAAGIRPINNIVDITNYVMLETGNPLHAFDYDKLHSNQIIVRDARDNETIQTLDGKRRVLDKNDMLITNGDIPIAIAGVMGGADTEVDSNTKTIFLEAATFDPIKVRKTSRKLDLRSESSMRFERGLDPKRTLMASNRAVRLMQELGGGAILEGINYFDVNVTEPMEISLSLSQLEQVTGIAYLPAEVEIVLTRLGFAHERHEGNYAIFVPSRRQDIKTYQDLIEEIVRLTGYHKIPLTYPKTPTTGYLTDRKQRIRKLRNNLLALGFHETITYSLVTREQASAFDESPKEVIAIINPLSEERACLRHSLLPSLINVARYNLARDIIDVSLFEIGRGYFPSDERLLLAGLLLGRHRPSLWQKQDNEADYYLLKGALTSLLHTIGITDIAFSHAAASLAHLHPGIAASVIASGEFVGQIGRLHPELEQKYELPATYVFEIDLETLLALPVRPKTMKPISKYPTVTRDLALVVADKVPVGELLEAVEGARLSALRHIQIFDIYKGDNLPRDAKSVAMTFSFQHDDKTLSTDEIDGFMNQIIKAVAALGASLR